MTRYLRAADGTTYRYFFLTTRGRESLLHMTNLLDIHDGPPCGKSLAEIASEPRDGVRESTVGLVAVLPASGMMCRGCHARRSAVLDAGGYDTDTL